MKFDGLDIYERDEELESKAGIELRFPNDIVFVVHRAGGANQKFERSKARHVKPFQRQIQAGTMDDKDLEDMLMKVYADSVVIDWRGVMSEGKAVECTSTNVLDMFRGYPDLFWAVKESCEDASLFRRAQVEEEAKNLGNS